MKPGNEIKRNHPRNCLSAAYLSRLDTKEIS
jgi:hypothetical protein